MDYDFIRQRITDLRMKKGVSEYQMSLDLGHSRSYVHNIVSGRSKPSVDELLYICEYLNVIPSNFFDENQTEPILIQKALEGMRTLSDKDLLAILSIIERFNVHK